MTAGSERPDDPPSYPRNRSFGALLIWHVAWGTRSNLGSTKRSSPWIPANLAINIHAPGTDLENAKKTFQNWRNQGRLPEVSDIEKVERLFLVLFGEAEALRFWKDDLRAALERDRGKTRAERKADSIAFRNELKRLSHDGPQKFGPISSYGETTPRASDRAIDDSSIASDAYPESYPRGGSFSELLRWHLKVWGTRPDCNLQEPNPPVDTWQFTLMTHHPMWWNRHRFMNRNVENWLSGKEVPVDPYSIDRVELELFGYDPRLAHWKRDLRDALSRNERR